VSVRRQRQDPEPRGERPAAGIDVRQLELDPVGLDSAHLLQHRAAGDVRRAGADEINA